MVLNKTSFDIILESIKHLCINQLTISFDLVNSVCFVNFIYAYTLKIEGKFSIVMVIFSFKWS